MRVRSIDSDQSTRPLRAREHGQGRRRARSYGAGREGASSATATVHPAPHPVSCSAEDRWRNNHCPMDRDFTTEQDWMQFLWAWHTVALDNDLGKMYTIFKATCQC